MLDVQSILERWQLTSSTVRERMYRSSTPRERERWHAVWLLGQGWSASQVATALERDAHTIGDWLDTLRTKGPDGLSFEQTGGSPPPSRRRNKPS